jgi:hypothetical protein
VTIENAKTERPFHALYTTIEKEHVTIQPVAKINVVIHQIITPNERSMLSSTR